MKPHLLLSFSFADVRLLHIVIRYLTLADGEWTVADQAPSSTGERVYRIFFSQNYRFSIYIHFILIFARNNSNVKKYLKQMYS